MRGSAVVWRAIEAARRQNLAEKGEIAPTAGSHAVTRRTLLQGLAAAGAIAAMPREAHAASVGRVAIIGGGIAGLTALHHLTEAGVEAHLFEARQRLGGRMFTQRPADGVAFEVGGQLVNTDHYDMHQLLRAFDLPLEDRKGETHRTLILAGGRLLSEPELVEGMRGIAEQIGKDADRLDKSQDRVSAELDRMSIKDYLDKHAALMPQPWARRLLEGTSRTEYGVEPEAASAIELIFNLPTVDGERFEVLGGADERYVIQGGSGALPQAMAAKYEAKIATGKRLLSVEKRRGGYALYFLDGSTAQADTVIIAVPAPITRQIDFRVPLPAVWRAFINQMDLGKNEKVQAHAAERVWRTPMGIGGELWQTDRAGYALGWDGTVHLPGGKADPVWTWFLGGDECNDVTTDPSVQAHDFARTSEPAIPGLTDGTAHGPYRRTAWHRDPLTLGAYCNYGPGFLTRFAHLLCVESDAGEHQVSRTGGIYFAGEHLSDAFPGYMNGAAQTGRMAAETITGKRFLKKAA